MISSKLKFSPAWLAVVLVAPASFYIGQFAMAANPTSATLIDKEMEACIHKLISKRFYNRISASDEQRSKLDAIWQTTADDTRPLREQLRSGMLDLSAMFAADSATDEQIANKAHELRALHSKIQDQRLDSMLKARKILTPEQRQKINDRIQDMITNGGGRIRQRISSAFDAD